MESSPKVRAEADGHLRISKSTASAYCAAFEVISSPVWIFDVSRHAIWWANGPAVRFWNAGSLDELTARDFSSDSHMVRQRLRQVFDTTPPGEHATDTWTLYPKGQPTIVSLHMTPVFIEDQREAILIEVHLVAAPDEDASALRILEAARNTPLRVSTATFEGEILSGNPAALDSYGVIDGHGAGRNRTLAQRIADAGVVRQILAAARDNRVFSQDIEVDTVHGRRWHHVTARRGRDPLSGDFVIVLTEEDVTERRSLYQQLYEMNSKLEERVWQRTKELEDKNRRLESLMQDAQAAKLRAEEATRAKSTFLASMSHELRTPLNAILGFSDVMLGEMLGALPARYRSYAEDINASATHLLGLINDLLDLSSIEEGRLALDEQRVEVESFVAECLRYVTPQAQARKVNIAVEMPPGTGAIRADRRRLCQVLVNVLSNAVKFTPADGDIAIRARRAPDGLSIEVSDTGAGIAPEDIDSVMEPYRSGKVVKADVQEGSGLGLYIAKALMESHDGFIFLDSVLGEGTKVRLELPKERLLD